MKYINDEQIINEAAQMLIEKHMDWSGSHMSMPSRDNGGVHGYIVNAYLEANYTAAEWADASDDERRFAEEQATVLYRQAKRLADKKWEAAMTLLGF